MRNLGRDSIWRVARGGGVWVMLKNECSSQLNRAIYSRGRETMVVSRAIRAQSNSKMRRPAASRYGGGCQSLWFAETCGDKLRLKPTVSLRRRIASATSYPIIHTNTTTRN